MAFDAPSRIDKIGPSSLGSLDVFLFRFALFFSVFLVLQNMLAVEALGRAQDAASLPADDWALSAPALDHHGHGTATWSLDTPPLI